MVGEIVKVKNNRPLKWFGKDYPEVIEVEILKVFKNGSFSARIKHHVCKKVQHFSISEIT